MLQIITSYMYHTNLTCRTSFCNGPQQGEQRFCSTVILALMHQGRQGSDFILCTGDFKIGYIVITRLNAALE